MHSQQQLINLLDLAIYVRNVPFFVLVLLYLRRCSIALHFIEKVRYLVITPMPPLQHRCVT